MSTATAPSKLDRHAMAKAVHDAAIALRVALSADWEYDESLDGDKRRTLYARVRTGDQVIALYGDTYRQRISISASWDAKGPDGKRIDAPYDMPRVAITVDPKRTPEAIAKDAVRRFMPMYESAWPK